MSAAPLRRPAGTAPPVRAAHLGLGSFFRAHQAWYTDRAADAAAWGIAAFSGRSAALADTLTRQDGLYTLVTRGAEADRFDVVRSLAQARPAADATAWLDRLACPEVGLLTVTVTEAGYLRDSSGRFDPARPAIAAEVTALRDRRWAEVRSAPGRIVAGLLARRRADAGPLAVVPCDNLPDNGAVLGGVLRDLATAVDPSLVPWMADHVSVVTTVVDRITPAPTPADRATVLAATGAEDGAPVVTEPFTEWILAGAFPAGRPAWESAGARFVADVRPYERRKLWLLNGAHSLLAYAAPLRGHRTVAEAVGDPVCLDWVEQWWDACARHLELPADDVAAYRAALVERFANPRIRHGLEQIAADGSQKLPVRALPVIRGERAAGRCGTAGARILAAWMLHLRGAGTAVTDVRSAQLRPLAEGPLPDAVPRVLAALDPALPDDREFVAAVHACLEELSPR